MGKGNQIGGRSVECNVVGNKVTGVGVGGRGLSPGGRRCVCTGKEVQIRLGSCLGSNCAVECVDRHCGTVPCVASRNGSNA